MITTTYSRGWGSAVALGPGQDHARRVLLEAIRHPSRAWHEAPTLRSFDRSPGTAHRLVHRLAALGVIAVQSTLGRDGGIRFTFGVRRWRTYPVRVGLSRRMHRSGPAVAQLAAWPDDELEEPDPPPGPAPRAPRMPWADRPGPELVPTPDGRRPTFREELERHGFRVPDAWTRREETTR
jgi:hypothetical protein